MAIESGVYVVIVVVVDSHAHFEAPGFQSTASIPPICDIPLTEVNQRLYGTQCRTDGLHLDWWDWIYLSPCRTPAVE